MTQPRGGNLKDQRALEMSVVVLTPDNYETIRKTIRRLRAQNVRHLLEVVIVSPSVKGLNADHSELKDFGQVRFVEIGLLTSTAKARVAGILEASTPVVAFVEDHAFPAKGWAQALIEAHRQPWSAVGPVLANANPRSLISWANLIIEYAEWLDPCPGGVAEHLPGHNGSYKRAHLLQYGQRLEAMMEAESVLQWDLRAKGYHLYLEPAAKTYHQNFSSAFSWIPLRFHGGRLFAASRARGWSPLRRLLYAGCAPAIPLVRLVRILRQLRRPGRERHLRPRILPALIAGLIVDGTGEMVGYSSGSGAAMRKLSEMEFHRERYLCKRDQGAQVEGEFIGPAPDGVTF
jgi:GT2 family glycosyltransferase